MFTKINNRNLYVGELRFYGGFDDILIDVKKCSSATDAFSHAMKLCEEHGTTIRIDTADNQTLDYIQDI